LEPEIETGADANERKVTGNEPVTAALPARVRKSPPRSQRATDVALLSFLIAVQIAWFALLVYALFWTVS
jgi:hypothetical protein